MNKKIKKKERKNAHTPAPNTKLVEYSNALKKEGTKKR